MSHRKIYKRMIGVLLMGASVLPAFGQRQTDKLDRGLVAVKTTNGVYCSWRINAEEYYDVAYNLYRDGTKLNDEPLKVSNFMDAAGGAENSTYTVTAVVNGKEGEHSKAAAVWAQKWLEITPDHGDLKSTYVPNDACCADVDGDGELEILMKFDNQSWAATSYQKAGYEGEYFIIEVYKLDGRKLWWIDLGPNMADFQNNEQNIVAYDWDQDGRAEAVMRASDGTVIHMADGSEYVIGDQTKNYLAPTSSSQWFVHEGQEFLVYMDGATGKPYQVMDYPLKRLETGETDLNAAWGDGYGHRSTKHFFGAPYLDGRKPSIFLARGIYTRHKMVAYDVNPETHELTERWRWSNNTPGSPWYAQGYHNFGIADVDWDGRDEICFGSMVIDDNGKGLSTTGLGHGDAQHHGDFNPYVHGHEIFACNEDEPANNYRDATTSKIYYRMTDTADDGRCMAGNFTNDFPGAMAFSAHDTPISCVTANHIDGLTKNGVTDNFRIYWDGDLLEETQNYSNGKNSAVAIYKYGTGEIERLTGSMTNNDTKGTPCYQGDILGDWREEVITRTKDNKIRIYTTTIPTDWRIPTLWSDHQYRQAMVWQMCGYNQPPHVSYFLGELEEITQAPPSLTMTGRTEVHDGETIDATFWRKQVIMAEPNDMTVHLSGPSCGTLIVNAPSWVQGHDDNDHIVTKLYTHTLTGTEIGNYDMRLVKQGDGILKFDPLVRHIYTGPTEIWAGKVIVGGGLECSPVWMNRFAQLETYPDSWACFRDVKAEYGSVIRPGGNHGYGSLAIDTLRLGFGSVLEMDLFSQQHGSNGCDGIGVRKLVIETKDWEYGPEYKAPVLRFISNLEGDQTVIPEGKYEILQIGEEIKGSLDDLVIEGLEGMMCYLESETNSDGFTRVFLVIGQTRASAEITWDGGTDGVWDFANTKNFKSASGEQDVFVTGDIVTFTDEASVTDITLKEDVSPAKLVFTNSEKDYKLSGNGSILGNATLIKRGNGKLTIENTNKQTGNTILEEGTLHVSALANKDGATYGNLGSVKAPIVFNGGTLAVTNTIVTSQPIKLESKGGTINVAAGKMLTTNGAINSNTKTSLHKTGNGTLVTDGPANIPGALYIDQGTVQGSENSGSWHMNADTVVINAGSLIDPDNIYSYSSNSTIVVVPEGAKGSWTLDSRCNYMGQLLGKGDLTINVTSVRSEIQGNWSQFEGTINFQKKKTGSYEPQLQWNNTHGLGKATVTGSFHNNGKDVLFGTLIDKTVITGSGRTTAKRLILDITKMKGTITHSYIEVAGTLIVSEVDINVKGTLKAGDEMVLWKAGVLKTTSDVVVNLPELPDGLYWDTTELLKKEGKLKVTDQPTSIRSLTPSPSPKGEGSDYYYTLDGRKLNGEPQQKGIYIYKGKKVVKR